MTHTRTLLATDLPVPGDIATFGLAGIFQEGAALALNNPGASVAEALDSLRKAGASPRETMAYGSGHTAGVDALAHGLTAILAPVLADFDVPATWDGHEGAYRAGVSDFLAGAHSDHPGVLNMGGGDTMAPQAYSAGFAAAESVAQALPWLKSTK
jgi:hypothetical protein